MIQNRAVSAEDKKMLKSASKKAPVAIHRGRFIVIRHRVTRKAVLVPLAPRVTKKGAPGPAETKQEVLQFSCTGFFWYSLGLYFFSLQNCSRNS